MNKLKDIVKNPSGWDSLSNFLGELPENDWLCLVIQNRDSDTLTESNFRSALKLLGGESKNVQVMRYGHWACGWWEALAVKENTPQAKIATEIDDKLQDYPVVDEEDWSELESETADKVWRDCYNTKERIEYMREHRTQFDFRSIQDAIACARGRYFLGYASELIG